MPQPAGPHIATLLAGRPKDIDDARALWQAHGGALDAERIRHVLAQFREALPRSDLRPAFERLGRPR